MPWPVPRRAPRKQQGFSVSSILKREGNTSRKRNALLIVGFDVSTWVGKGRRKDPVLEAPAQPREVAREDDTSLCRPEPMRVLWGLVCWGGDPGCHGSGAGPGRSQVTSGSCGGDPGRLLSLLPAVSGSELPCAPQGAGRSPPVSLLIVFKVIKQNHLEGERLLK